MSRVVLLGTGSTATLAHLYLTMDSEHEVVAATVDREHLTTPSFRGLPVVPLDEVVERYPPHDVEMFVTVGYGRVNRFRAEKYQQAKELGYRLISYVSSRAHVGPEAAIGDNCFIMPDAIVEPFARVGNDVIMWNTSHVSHEAIVDDHVFLSARALVGGGAHVEAACFIGMGATLRDSVTVATECVIGAGALILRSTQPRQVFVGPEARLLRMPSNRLVSL
jgi:sugar O-acyltransferase (sialic acid O-acetyltransferase NeuD family)